MSAAAFLTPIDELAAAIRADDAPGFHRISGEVWRWVLQAPPPEELTAAIERIAEILPGCGGVFAKAAVLAGSLVERGGSPLSLREVLPRRAAVAMEMRARFPAVWATATEGRPLPDPGAAALLSDVLRGLTQNTERTGLSFDESFIIGMSWFDAEDWMLPMLSVLSDRGFRAAMAHRERVRAAAEALADDSQRAYWLVGLTAVLDEEPLLVLDPAAGRGFLLTMSGVGDNFQLHTLLADRLIGPGLLAGERPDPAWVEAATTGHPGPMPMEQPIHRRFRLFDGHGAYVYPEGRPADVAPLAGTRVLMLLPPNGDYGWTTGRTYQHLVPELRFERELTTQEAAAWLERVSPARQEDLFRPRP